MMAVIFSFSTAEAVGEGPYLQPNCKLPSSVFVVTVKQDGDKPVYEYTVTNNYDKPINSIALGWGPEGWLYMFDELEPVEIISPEGWKGHFRGTESPFRFYLWQTAAEKYEDSLKQTIKPGETLSGFILIMSEQLDIMKHLPFKIRSDITKCAFGTVVEE